jgi:integrating conjugative element protein (TIGR03752 family)
MSKNPKMLIIIGGFSLFLIIGLFWMTAKKSPQKAANSSNSSNQQQKKLFDVASGDTNNEVLRTILAKQQKIENDNQKLQQENAKLKSQGFKSLQDELQKMQSTVSQKFSQFKSTVDQRFTGQKRELDQVKGKVTSKFSGAQNSQNNSQFELNGAETDGKNHVIGNVPDLTASLHTSNTESVADNTANDKEDQSTPKLPSETASSDRDDKPIPYYTVPANSTLNNVSLMSSIIGEVPVSGKLVAPAFPFKAIVGKKDLLAANGLTLPSDLAGMVLEGYSVGNMTMSCARAYVTKALFVFNDGHFVIYPQKDQDSGATSLYPKNALGYLSDTYGNTCIFGKYITDAPKVLGSIVAITTAGGVGDAIAQAQTTTMSDASQTTQIISGSLAKYATGQAIGNTSQQVLNWYLNRVSDVFDAVYIPASKEHKPVKLVFNVTQTIPIDLDLKGRTLRNENNKNNHINTKLD